MTELFMTDVSPLFEKEKCGSVLESFSGELYFHIKRKKILNDRARSAGAYLCLFLALKELGINASVSDVSFDGSGKPFFKNSGPFFSVSHSGKYAVVAISDQPVGVDVEQEERITPSISRRFLGGKGVGEWTKREARGKITGRGFTEGELPGVVYTDLSFGGYFVTVCGYEKAGKIREIAPGL